MTSGQETERVNSYNPGARMGQQRTKHTTFVYCKHTQKLCSVTDALKKQRVEQRLVKHTVVKCLSLMSGCSCVY